MSGDERGAVTAELAMGIPLLVSLTLALVWMLTVGVTQARLFDAAREAARADARGDGPTAAVASARRVAPGSAVTLTRTGGWVEATASAELRPPSGLLAFLPPVHLHAEAVTTAEAETS